MLLSLPRTLLWLPSFLRRKAKVLPWPLRPLVWPLLSIPTRSLLTGYLLGLCPCRSSCLECFPPAAWAPPVHPRGLSPLQAGLPWPRPRAKLPHRRFPASLLVVFPSWDLSSQVYLGDEQNNPVLPQQVLILRVENLRFESWLCCFSAGWTGPSPLFLLTLVSLSVKWGWSSPPPIGHYEDTREIARPWMPTPFT